MRPEGEVTLDRAREASADELNPLLHEADEKIIVALLDNPNFREKHAELLLDRADLSARVIGAVAESAKGKWMACEGVRLRVAQHPHTPKRLALTALRQIFLFNLVRLSLMPSVPGDIRRAAEEAILTRVPHLPVGEKLTLARRGPARVAGAILAEGHPQALKLALANGFLTESQVLKILAKDGVPERVVVAIANHAKWSSLYNVRVALVRSAHAPLARVQEFLKDLILRDLDELAKMRELSAGVRKAIAQELGRRAEKSARADASNEEGHE
jgi:hypothetical protein